MSNLNRAGRAVVLALGMFSLAGALSGCAVGVSAGAGAAVTVSDPSSDRPRAAITSDPYMTPAAAAAERAASEAAGHPRR